VVDIRAVRFAGRLACRSSLHSRGRGGCRVVDSRRLTCWGSAACCGAGAACGGSENSACRGSAACGGTVCCVDADCCGEASAGALSPGSSAGSSDCMHSSNLTAADSAPNSLGAVPLARSSCTSLILSRTPGRGCVASRGAARVGTRSANHLSETSMMACAVISATSMYSNEFGGLLWSPKLRMALSSRE